MNTENVGNTNLLRFYVDDNDKIYKCDYFENIAGMIHETINVRQETLKRLFNKYIKDQRIYHEEKIYDSFILYKFYDVDINEIYELIRMSRANQRAAQYSKPKQNENTNNRPNRPVSKPTGKVKRVNKFNGKKVIATLVTIAILATGVSLAINSISKKTQETEPSTLVSSEYTEKQEQTETEAPTTEEETIKEVIYDQYIDITTEDSVGDEKYTWCKEHYYDIIEKYAKMYGIDPELAFAIACQERGYHSEEVDEKGGLGLFQIQIEGRFNWDNKDVTAYNFETQSMESYTIHKDEIRNVDANIKAGIMIFQEALRRNDYDVARALQEYNFGYGNMQEVLKECYGEDAGEGKTDLDWLNYRYIIKNGDQLYIEHVLRFAPDGIVFTITRRDGTTITVQFNNVPQGKLVMS